MTQDADALITSPNGTVVFGIVCECAAAAAGISCAPIVLKYGLGTVRGFGLEHIRTQRERMAGISGLGFSGAIEFVFYVCQGWTKVLRGKDGKVLLVCERHGRDLTVVLDHRNDEWSVTTAMAYRVARGVLLFQRPRAEGSEIPRAMVKRTRFETLSLPNSKD